MKALCLLALIATFLAVSAAPSKPDAAKWAHTYRYRGNPRRLEQNFLANAARVERMNSQLGPRPELSLSGPYAGLTKAQTQRILGGVLPLDEDEYVPRPPRRFTAKKSPGGPIPTKLDWREKIRFTPARSQGNCGSCYAFAIAGALESQLAIRSASKTVSEVSPQYMVDCAEYTMPVSGRKVRPVCDGGLIEEVTRWVSSSGFFAKESAYPYNLDTLGTCRASSIPASGRVNARIEYTALPRNPRAIMEALARYGPLVVQVNILPDAFGLYQSGVIPAATCPQLRLNARGLIGQLSHAVLLVGYTEVEGKPVWIIRNSSGLRWGQQGYAYLERSDNLDENACGVAQAAHLIRLV